MKKVKKLYLRSRSILSIFLVPLITICFILFTPSALIKAQAKKISYTTKTVTNARVLFIGDSRTVDMFSGKKTKLKGKVKNNITVYALDGADCADMVQILDDVDLDDYDVVVTWMGTNDKGDFSSYIEPYNRLRKRGIKLILCTVGFTDTSKIEDEEDIEFYSNDLVKQYNSALKKYAQKNGIGIIDLYKYTEHHIRIQSHNGIHYSPKPTKKLWNYIVKKLIKKFSL